MKGKVKVVNLEAVKIRLGRRFDASVMDDIKATLEDIPATEGTIEARWNYVAKEPAFYHCSNCLSFSYYMRPYCPSCNSTMVNYEKGDVI